MHIEQSLQRENEFGGESNSSVCVFVKKKKRLLADARMPCHNEVQEEPFFILHRTSRRNTHLTAGATSHLSWMCLSGRAAARQVQKSSFPSRSSPRSCSSSSPTEGCSSPARGCAQIADNHMSKTLDTVLLYVGKRSDWIPIGSDCLRGISELWGQTAKSAASISHYIPERRLAHLGNKNRLWAPSSDL